MYTATDIDFLVSENIIVQVKEYGHNSLIAYYFSYNSDQIKLREKLPSYGHFGICKYEGDTPTFLSKWGFGGHVFKQESPLRLLTMYGNETHIFKINQ